MSKLMAAIKILAEQALATENTIVTAESCTAGGIGYYLTKLPGSSAWFDRGFITYSNEAKVELLEVPKALLDEFGAVSEPVAIAMANGALTHSTASLSVSVTGIAGPDGGSLDKPVGTVWIAWASRERAAFAQCYQFHGDRDEVRIQTIQSAVEGLIRLMP